MKCRCAVIQCVSSGDLDENLSQVEMLLSHAAKQKAEIAVLPENFAYFATGGALDKAALERTERGPVLQFLSRMALEHKLFLIGGSTPLLDDGYGSSAPENKVYASCVVVDPQGVKVGQYNKMHLFDADVADAVGAYRESTTYARGETPIVVRTPWGGLGLSICYDLRFPEYFRSVISTEVTMVAVPSAFTFETGKAHWEILLRARAIENQVFVLAANQGGFHLNNRQTWGHSMIIDPWGKILAEVVESGPGLAVADLDFAHLEEVRRQLPVLKHRRLVTT